MSATIRHHNPAYWPDVELPASLAATTDPATALDGADYLVLSIPAQSPVALGAARPS